MADRAQLDVAVDWYLAFQRCKLTGRADEVAFVRSRLVEEMLALHGADVNAVARLAALRCKHFDLFAGWCHGSRGSDPSFCGSHRPAPIRKPRTSKPPEQCRMSVGPAGHWRCNNVVAYGSGSYCELHRTEAGRRKARILHAPVSTTIRDSVPDEQVEQPRPRWRDWRPQVHDAPIVVVPIAEVDALPVESSHVLHESIDRIGNQLLTWGYASYRRLRQRSRRYEGFTYSHV